MVANLTLRWAYQHSFLLRYTLGALITDKVKHSKQYIVMHGKGKRERQFEKLNLITVCIYVDLT